MTVAGCSSSRDAASVLRDAQQAMGTVNSIQQQQNTEVNRDKAWNVGPNGPAPQPPATAEERQLAIVTHQSNVPYFTKTLVAPATLSPDAQSKAMKTPTLQGVTGKEILTDGKQTIEVYATRRQHSHQRVHADLSAGVEDPDRGRCVQPWTARCASARHASGQCGRALR